MQERSQNLRHFYPGMGLKLGAFGFFPKLKWLWFVCHLHLLRSKCENKNVLKCCTVRKDHGRICFEVIFACVVGKNPNTPNLSPMADDAITQGGIPGLGSLFYICGLPPRTLKVEKFELKPYRKISFLTTEILLQQEYLVKIEEQLWRYRSCAVSTMVLFFTKVWCCTRLPQDTENWNWRNAWLEDLNIWFVTHLRHPWLTLFPSRKYHNPTGSSLYTYVSMQPSKLNEPIDPGSYTHPRKRKD